HSSVQRTPKFLPLNFGTARLVGLWIAEGSTSKTGAINFAIGSHENEITEFLAQTIKKYFPYANVVVRDHERNRRVVRFCNRRFAEWLRENIGHRAHEKRIPDVLLFNENREVRLGLVRGLIEGDGYIRRDNSRRANYISYTTVSPTLA
ncbi:LAGLIDADG family homing endonuclease, partial [Thermococcus sp. 21S7]|uniref:LAGLIDADG family homing endonuclease n=1 Tax=Thermococcus sp. 21S7 TaxID=1638221 RepID=UPI00143B05FB